MPDLQSELSKVLTQANFDDEPDNDAAPAAVNTNRRHLVWEHLRKHPMSDSAEVAGALGITSNEASTVLAQLHSLGEVSRSQNERTGRFMYTTTATTRNVLSAAEKIARLNAARKAAAERRRAALEGSPPSTTKKRGRPRKSAVAATKNPSPALAQSATKKSFNADEILAGLNVLQARELMDKLRKLFGV